MELGHNLRAVFNGTRTCISAKSIELRLFVALRFYTYHERRNCMTSINTLNNFTVGGLRRESSLRISHFSLVYLSLLSSLSRRNVSKKLDRPNAPDNHPVLVFELISKNMQPSLRLGSSSKECHLYSR